MFLGLDTDAWTAISAIAAILALPISIAGLSRRSSKERTNPTGENTSPSLDESGVGVAPADEERTRADASGEEGAEPEAGSTDPDAPKAESSTPSPGVAVPPLYWEPAEGSVTLHQVESGGALARLLDAAEMYQQSFEEPTTEEDVALVRDFLQTTHDWGEALDDADHAGVRVDAGWELSRELKLLHDAGWLVYAGTSERVAVANGNRVPLQAVHIRVVRQRAQAAA